MLTQVWAMLKLWLHHDLSLMGVRAPVCFNAFWEVKSIRLKLFAKSSVEPKDQVCTRLSSLLKEVFYNMTLWQKECDSPGEYIWQEWMTNCFCHNIKLRWNERMQYQIQWLGSWGAEKLEVYVDKKYNKNNFQIVRWGIGTPHLRNPGSVTDLVKLK